MGQTTYAATEYTIDIFEIADMITSATDLSSNCIEYHEKRVAYIARRIFEAAFGREAPQELIIAGLLHDIGVKTGEMKSNLGKLFPDEGDLERHSAEGEELLDGVDLFKGIPAIIRNHHRNYSTIVDRSGIDVAILANIINLADRVDISIDYNNNILLQVDSVLKNISSFTEGFFYKDAYDAFMNISGNKSFWLDLNNKPLIECSIRQAISRKLQMGCDAISQVTDLCARIIDRKSPYTAKHSICVSLAAERIGRLLNMSEEQCFLISAAGKLHDLGKLSVPEGILHKPGSLDRDEFRIIQQHTYYTYHIMDKVAMFGEIKKWAAYHHENLDGSGYPFGVSGDEIGLEARIIAVVDKLVALTEDRPYRGKRQKGEVLEILTGMCARNLIDINIVNIVSNQYEPLLDGI